MRMHPPVSQHLWYSFAVFSEGCLQHPSPLACFDLMAFNVLLSGRRGKREAQKSRELTQPRDDSGVSPNGRDTRKLDFSLVSFEITSQSIPSKRETERERERRESERDGERQTDTDTDTDTRTHSHADTQTNRHTDKQPHRHTDTET